MLAQRNPVNLKTVAAQVGLAPCSVSAILNNTEAARAIPQSTKERVYRAATELNYRPNHWARSLRTKQTRMVAVLAPELGRGAVAQIVASIQQNLQRLGYLLVLISSDSEDANRLSLHLQQRGIEGMIAVGADLPGQLSMPMVNVNAGAELTDHSAAAWLLEIGKFAALQVIQQIENPDASNDSIVEPSLPQAFFASKSANTGLPGRTETA